MGTVLSPTQELLRRLSFARCGAELYIKLINSFDPIELYTLLRYTLFGNILCLGQAWNLERIERLLGYSMISQVTFTLVLHQVGEHVEMSDWLATEIIRRAGIEKVNVEGIIIQICGGDLEPYTMSELTKTVLESMDEARIGGILIALPPGVSALSRTPNHVLSLRIAPCQQPNKRSWNWPSRQDITREMFLFRPLKMMVRTTFRVMMKIFILKNRYMT